MRHAATGPDGRRDLDKFSKLLSGFTKFDRIRVAGEIQQSDPLNASASSSIVSAIEFDMDFNMFATAGVSKRIQFFNFSQVCAGAQAGVISRNKPTRRVCMSITRHRYPTPLNPEP
jgi:E3 ubiquitin-protein ligase RFWD2